MAADEREWELRWLGEFERWVLTAQSHQAHPSSSGGGEKVKVIPESRAEAAEQRVRELELEAERYRRLATDIIFNLAEDCGRQMATAVEALRWYAADEVWVEKRGPGGIWPPEAHVVRGLRARNALSEIEGGEG